MIYTIAISGYRSLKEMVLPIGPSTLVTGANGSGKSSVYRSLRMLAEVANGQLVRSLAREGGLSSTLWAGPEKFSAEMLSGEIPIQGTKRKKPIALRLGFSSDDFSYAIDLGLPAPAKTMFGRDPIIKRECLWRGRSMNARSLCIDRRGAVVRWRPERKWETPNFHIGPTTSVLTEVVDPERAPELLLMRDMIRDWRFYDQLRTDAEAPARKLEIGTFSPVLADDGGNLAAALQTIREIGDIEALNLAIDNAFPGSHLSIGSTNGRFEVLLRQAGLLRALSTNELSDGTLRFLLLVAALLTPRPPELMVLNEPETSLHPSLVPALGDLIKSYSVDNQVVVVTHCEVLVDRLKDTSEHLQLEKSLGETKLQSVDPFDLPNWEWPKR